MLVKELYRDCFSSGQSSLAYYLFHLLAENKIALEDDASKIDLNQADDQKVAELMAKNFLTVDKVGVYSLTINQEAFAFIYARSREEAIQFFIRSFQKTPLNCYEYLLDFEIIRGNEVISFRKLRKEFKSFPAIAGCFIREGNEKE